MRIAPVLINGLKGTMIKIVEGQDFPLWLSGNKSDQHP